MSMWTVRIDGFPGLPFDTWDEAHEYVWRAGQEINDVENLMFQENKQFCTVVGNHLYMVQEVEMAHNG